MYAEFGVPAVGEPGALSHKLHISQGPSPTSCMSYRGPLPPGALSRQGPSPTSTALTHTRYAEFGVPAVGEPGALSPGLLKLTCWVSDTNASTLEALTHTRCAEFGVPAVGEPGAAAGLLKYP